MSLLDNVKDVAKLAQEVGKMELYQKAVELMAQVTELAEENFQLKQELAALEEKENIAATLAFSRNVYYRLVGGKYDGPFCSCCWDSKSKLIRMHDLRHCFPRCPICQQEIYGGVGTAPNSPKVQVQAGEIPP